MWTMLAGVPGKLTTLMDRLTSTRATNLDRLDTTITSRAPSSTALSNAVWTNDRATKLDQLSRHNTFQNLFVFETSRTFIVPFSCRLMITAIGGGGNGALRSGSVPTAGTRLIVRGGSSGAVAVKIIEVTAGASFTITVGAGGALYTHQNGQRNGNNGTATTVVGPGVNITCPGGLGGGVSSGAALGATTAGTAGANIATGGDVNRPGTPTRAIIWSTSGRTCHSGGAATPIAAAVPVSTVTLSPSHTTVDTSAAATTIEGDTGNYFETPFIPLFGRAMENYGLVSNPFGGTHGALGNSSVHPQPSVPSGRFGSGTGGFVHINNTNNHTLTVGAGGSGAVFFSMVL